MVWSGLEEVDDPWSMRRVKEVIWAAGGYEPILFHERNPFLNS